MTLQFLGLVIASFGAGQSKTGVGDYSEQPWHLPQLLCLSVAGPPASPPLRAAHRDGLGLGGE